MVRERVLRARNVQLKRYAGEKKVHANTQMPARLLRKVCEISAEGGKAAEDRDPALKSLRARA